MISAVILAAGNSSRMGSPKAALKIGGRTFIEIIISNLRKAGIDRISVVLGKDRDIVLEKWRPNGEKLVFNDRPELGQIHSLRLALENGINDSFMVCLADQPLIKPETYEMIKDFALKNPDSLIIPKFFKEFSPSEKRYKRGHPIVIAKIYKELCFQGPIDKGLHWVTHHESVNVKELEVADPGILKDFDTPEDYQNLFSGSNL